EEDEAGPGPAVPTLDDERLAGGAVGEAFALALRDEDPGLVAARQPPEQARVAGARPPAGGRAGDPQRLGARLERAVPVQAPADGLGQHGGGQGALLGEQVMAVMGGPAHPRSQAAAVLTRIGLLQSLGAVIGQERRAAPLDEGAAAPV